MQIGSVSSLSPLTVPLKRIQTNVVSDKEAKVIVFLVNHDNTSHSLIIRNYIAQAHSNKGVLLVEDSHEVVEWSQRLPTICWEDKKILDEVLKTEKVFHGLKETISHLNDEAYLMEVKIKAVQQTLVNAKALKLISNIKSYYEKIVVYLQQMDLYQNELLKEKQNLLCWLAKVHRTFVHQAIEKTFPARQNALIDCIKAKIRDSRDDSEKIFVICGISHGDPGVSRFPKEAARLLEFLHKETNYWVCNLEGPAGPVN